MLSSSDANENKNGAALVINTAANAQSVPKLLRSNIVSLLLPKLNSHDEDLVMKACWAVNNLSVHDEGRNACFSGGVLQYFGKVLQSRSSEVIKKASWALTNLARNPEAQKEIIRGSVFTGLVNVLNYGKDDEEKGFVLQPLCNLVLDANNQLAFKNAGGLAAAVKLMSSTVDKTQELSVTLISFVTTNHDSIRDELVDHGVLYPLSDLLNGSKTGKLQEYAINSLVNLSLSEHAEKAILQQGAVRPVVGLLSSSDPRLQQQAAMLLSNLLTNKDIRESVRYYAWVDPLLKLMRTGDSSTLQQALRVIINITFDEHCRYQLQKADATSVINGITSSNSDNAVYGLSNTAIKNLSVPVSAAIQGEVNNRLATGSVEQINAPRAAQQAKADYDLGGLNDVLNSYGGSASSTPAKKPTPASKPVDDLDDILGSISTPTRKPDPPKPASNPPKPAQAKSSGYDLDLDDLLGDVSKPAPKPAAHQSQVKAPPPKKNDLDDIDDLLAGIDLGTNKKAPPPKAQAPPPQPSRHDDIDDLLSDFDTGNRKQPQGRSTVKAPPPKSNDLDDIDNLLADMTPSRQTGGASRNAPNPRASAAADDIDDLLNGIGGYGGSGGGYGGAGGGRGQSSYSSNYGDDIDDLLSDLSGPPRASNRNQPANRGQSTRAPSGLDAIDDLLADLTG
uniref:Importin subunit alpha n=1 Tax=Arcella intermedia TaxID=1963864 RepID=A0A6B2KYY5_9EUKA